MTVHMSKGHTLTRPLRHKQPTWGGWGRVWGRERGALGPRLPDEIQCGANFLKVTKKAPAAGES